MEQTRYGLIGSKLGHSYSKIIHEQIADYTYELMPLPTEGEARTFVDRVIGNVWFVMGSTALFVSLLTLFTPMRLPILFIILLIMGMGAAVTGLIVRFTPTIVGGIAAIILAPCTLLAGNMWQPLLFIAGFVVMMIVPGHILNHTSNRPQR